MTDRDSQDTTETPAAKDPADWTTGDEPITGPQRSYLETLAQQAGQEAPENLDGLTKAEASRRIDELQQAAGRG
ncbi:DUF3072 domain-containing protein [Pseudonocardia pini]|uniref:DUF3072 domain-containing protein n=1 Tax=Pseudonocardia pini TaxID=2758030 RepID=UPI0015F04416|nr:DUF3072 domain-containing protein [Pseudonocardia pini]